MHRLIMLVYRFIDLDFKPDIRIQPVGIGPDIVPKPEAWQGQVGNLSERSGGWA